MSDTRYVSFWQALPNPFLPFTVEEMPSDTRSSESNETTIGHVSGRKADIIEIITGGQSAIILAGAPHIGKSTLVNYLQRSPREWSWRNELHFSEQLDLDAIHFVKINLKPLIETERSEDVLNIFVKECILAVQSVYRLYRERMSVLYTLKGLRELLRCMKQEIPHIRCFVMLDDIESLEKSGIALPDLSSKAQTPQEHSIALLDHYGIIRMLVDLNDEFRNFGIILSIETLPRPSITDQFSHISADLARFTTITLQTFTWQDALDFLDQKPDDFGNVWAIKFKTLGGEDIFSKNEQAWLLEQAGTHPYLLQQSCFYAFHLKKQYTHIYRTWTELMETGKQQLIEKINERLSTFLDNQWKRIQKAMSQSSQETREQFHQFLLAPDAYANKVIPPTTWNEWESELRYILYSEGILRDDHDPSQFIRYPGAILLDYFIRKAQVQQLRSTTTTLSFGSSSQPESRWLSINCADDRHERLSLSEQEYLLFQTLLQHPQSCTTQLLMERVWGKEIKRETFTQAIHRLRQKLKKYCGETEIIENIYGGKYSLNHPAWFQLE